MHKAKSFVSQINLEFRFFEVSLKPNIDFKIKSNIVAYFSFD